MGVSRLINDLARCGTNFILKVWMSSSWLPSVEVWIQGSSFSNECCVSRQWWAKFETDSWGFCCIEWYVARRLQICWSFGIPRCKQRALTQSWYREEIRPLTSYGKLGSCEKLQMSSWHRRREGPFGNWHCCFKYGIQYLWSTFEDWRTCVNRLEKDRYFHHHESLEDIEAVGIEQLTRIPVRLKRQTDRGQP